MGRGSGAWRADSIIRPYTATSFTQFWRNWHISLTEWIRIYLFYPLERVSRNRIWLYITPILVMAMVGFWHGANWTFIVWGLLFGVGMSFERITGLNRPGVKLWARLGWTLITQLAVFFGWIFFRSSSVNEGWHFIVNIFHGFATPGLLLPTQEVLNTAFPLISYWAGSTDRSLYNLIFPALIDLLPILTILLIHLSSFWENSQQKDETTIVVGIGKAILAGIMLFFCLSVYSAVPSPYLYFKF